MAGTLRSESYGEIQGIPVTTPVAAKRLLNMPPSPPFFYKWHPERWTCMDGEWLPQLGILRVEPGVGGVDARGDHTIAATIAQKHGWTLIPWEVIPDGYCRAFPGRSGPVHLSKWETPRQITADRVQIDSDTEGYRDFLRMLVSTGIIPAPDPAITGMVMDTAERRVERAAARPESEGARRGVKRAEARVESMKKASSKLDSGDSDPGNSRKGK